MSHKNPEGAGEKAGSKAGFEMGSRIFLPLNRPRHLFNFLEARFSGEHF
jgi:hypothetical protein